MKLFSYLNYKKIFKQWRGVLIVAPSIVGLVIILRLAGWLQIWELMALDRFFSLRLSDLPDPPITIVGISVHLQENDRICMPKMVYGTKR